MNLQEHINRIKQVMGLHENETPSISDYHKKVIKAVLTGFITRPVIYDSDYDLAGGYFIITLGKNDKYMVQYDFDVDITSHSSYDSGSWDEPPSGEPAEYDLTITKLTLYIDGDEAYEGPDITDFMNIKTKESTRYGELTGEDILRNHVDERIQELEADY